MTIKELQTKLPTLKEDERLILGPLMGMLCPLSVGQMKKFQSEWDFEGNPPPDGFDHFVVAQNKELLDCLKMELSPVGAIARKEFGMAPLTEDTEII